MANAPAGNHWQSVEYQSRFQYAAEVDCAFRDVMWEIIHNGMRQPGEPVEHFAERAAQQPVTRFCDGCANWTYSVHPPSLSS